FPDRDRWLDAFRSQPGSFQAVEPFSTQGRANTQWSIGEDIFSTFGMLTVDVGELRILGGARVEHTRNASTANEVVVETVDGRQAVTAINPRDSNSSYTNVLPGVHFRLNAADNLIVRGAVNRTMSRPAPGDLIPSIQVNAQLTQPAVIVGNPDLVPATSTNLDLGAEYYLTGLGIVSAGAFYKSVDNFVFSERTRLDSGPFAGFDEVRRVNGDGGTVLGLELAWGQQFHALPGALSGLGIESNLTLLRSRGVVPGREDDDLPLVRSPSWVTNLALTYTQGPLQARGTFMARSDRLTGVGGRAALDRYNQADQNLDFSLEYALPRMGTRAFLHTRNLLNVATIEYQGSTDNPVSTAYYGRQLNIGLSYDVR
ncbi:MAG: TonB-dependent receptor, partial [Gemmatimonadales bacterium]